MQWWQYAFFFFYSFILGVGLRFVFKAPGISAKDVWIYINTNTKEVLGSGLCWLLVFGLWVTAPQWTEGMKNPWLVAKLSTFEQNRYFAPLVAWLADSIVKNLVVWFQLLLEHIFGLVKKFIPKAPVQ